MEGTAALANIWDNGGAFKCHMGLFTKVQVAIHNEGIPGKIEAHFHQVV